MKFTSENTPQNILELMAAARNNQIEYEDDFYDLDHLYSIIHKSFKELHIKSNIDTNNSEIPSEIHSTIEINFIEILLTSIVDSDKEYNHSEKKLINLIVKCFTKLKIEHTEKFKEWLQINELIPLSL